MCPFLCSVHLSVYRYVGFGRYTLVLYFHELFCLLLFLVQLYEHSYSLRSTVNRSRNDNPLSLPPFCSLLRCLPTHSSHDRLNWPPKSSRRRRPSLPPSLRGMSKQWLACLLGLPSLPPFARPNVDLSLKPLLSPFVGVFLPSLIVCLSPFWSFFFPAARRSSFSPSKPISLPPLPFACSLRRFGLERGKTGLPHVRPPFRYPPQFERGRSAGGSAAVAAFQVSSLPPLPTFFFLPLPAPGLSVCGREEEGRRGIRRGREGKGGGVGIRNRLVRGSPEHKKSFAKVESGMRVVGQR